MTLGPVQILVVGFEDPQFKGDILAELKRLREEEIVRVIDVAVVKKDDEGNVERYQHSDLSEEELEEFGATIGALTGLGFAGEEGLEAGAEMGAEAMEGGHALGDVGEWYVDDAIPNGTAAAIVLLEHHWAIPLRESIRDAGGFLLADSWIHPSDLIAVGLLAREEAEKTGAV
jgi:uncharacterized membrane protein